MTTLTLRTPLPRWRRDLLQQPGRMAYLRYWACDERNRRIFNPHGHTVVPVRGMDGRALVPAVTRGGRRG